MVDAGRMHLAEVVARTGVPASTIHHYRRAGLLPATAGHSGRLTYDERHVRALEAVKMLREVHGLPLARIAEVLPEVLAATEAAATEEATAGGGGGRAATSSGQPLAAVERALQACEAATGRRRAIESATQLFGARSYGEVTVAEVAAAAGMAKGSVYRHFPSKEALFDAVIEDLLATTAADFATAVAGSPAPASAFATAVARAMPILLELGARAAKGHEPSRVLARRVLVTLAGAAGAPVAAATDDPTTVGLGLIEEAFAMVLRWAVDGYWIDRASGGAEVDRPGAERR